MMAAPICLHDKGQIERYLRGDVYLHIYGIGDLDDFFWPYTCWFASKSEAGLDAVVLLYVGQSLPTLLALSQQTEAMCALLQSITHLLPRRFYAHLSPGVESAFGRSYRLDGHGEHYKMALLREGDVTERDTTDVVPLAASDLDEILVFYESSYPGNWFDPRMLETQQYVGVRDRGQLVSVAGIHVYSQQYRVAALGNIATLPSHRGRGYATRATAKVCQSLLRDAQHIGANVKTDNAPALCCYRSLGFEVVASYGEFMVERIEG
jgi:ribosomal protein S18 acetylase RimI-like enzyme